MDAKIILGGVVTLAVLVGGCGVKKSAPPASRGGDEATAVKSAVQPAAKPQTTCPVMGGGINKSIFADHDGKRVYFCCGACISTFKKDPAKYVKKLEDAGVTIEKAPAGSTEESKPEGHGGMEHPRR